MLAWTLVIVALCVPGTVGHPWFRHSIPNGEHVPNPCRPNERWPGVGHMNQGGGGPRNPFGLDFAKHSFSWTAVCPLDSDGDGLTNGQELGDPDCVWTPGTIPSRTTGLSHPGVCDPLRGDQCVSNNSWVDCSEFSCDFRSTDVRNVTIRIPRTDVPAKKTTYICQNFQLPHDQEYHLIATKPIVDNPWVVHHMLLTTCDQTVSPPSASQKPQECLMGSLGCSFAIGVWTVGLKGECHNPEAGFRIGKNGTGVVSLQIHWNNPRGEDGMTDSTGLILYYTPKLRKYNAASLAVGQTALTIPPRMSSVVHKGTCTSRCTSRLMRGPVHIFYALNHMHNLGIRQNLTLNSPGVASLVLTDDNPYSFYNPKVHKFNDTITMRPGDELQTYCTYQSHHRDRTTKYGLGTADEMCFAIVTYFPAENISEASCVQWQDVDFCDHGGNCLEPTLFNSSAPNTTTMLDTILDNCDPYGDCRAECPGAVKKVRQDYPCLDKLWDFLATAYYGMDDAKFLKFVAAFRSCDSSSGTAPSCVGSGLGVVGFAVVAIVGVVVVVV